MADKNKPMKTKSSANLPAKIYEPTPRELAAVDAQGALTKLGRRMAELPVDPRFARMLLAGDQAGCLAEVLVITSALSIQDPRERPVDKQQAGIDDKADTRHG